MRIAFSLSVLVLLLSWLAGCSGNAANSKVDIGKRKVGIAYNKGCNLTGKDGVDTLKVPIGKTYPEGVFRGFGKTEEEGRQEAKKRMMEYVLEGKISKHSQSPVFKNIMANLLDKTQNFILDVRLESHKRYDQEKFEFFFRFEVDSKKILAELEKEYQSLKLFQTKHIVILSSGDKDLTDVTIQIEEALKKSGFRVFKEEIKRSQIGIIREMLKNNIDKRLELAFRYNAELVVLLIPSNLLAIEMFDSISGELIASTSEEIRTRPPHEVGNKLAASLVDSIFLHLSRGFANRFRFIFVKPDKTEEIKKAMEHFPLAKSYNSLVDKNLLILEADYQGKPEDIFMFPEIVASHINAKTKNDFYVRFQFGNFVVYDIRDP